MAARKKKYGVLEAVKALNEAIYEEKRGRGGIDRSDGELLMKLAIDIINQDYWDDVRGVTADLIREIKAGDITDREQLDEAINQAIDGTQRVIYTFQAKLGMLATNNADAYEEATGEKPNSIEQAMAFAMIEDVRAQLEAEDVDSLLSGGDSDD